MKQTVRLTCLVVLTALGGASASAEVTRYDGLCEASGAVALDEQRFLVVSDDMDVALIYRRGVATPEGGTIQLPNVSDLEAVTRVGDTIFLLTGHSVTKKTPPEDKTKRKQLIALQVADDGSVSVVGNVYRNLRADIQSLLLQSLPNVQIDDGDHSVANFEGLASTPEGSLLIGLRSPIKDNSAVIVRIDMPMGLVGLGQPDHVEPTFLELPPLDLGGRGIRSLEARPDGGYVIVAGSVDDADQAEAQIYLWDGMTSVEAIAVSELSMIKPEAAFFWADGTLMILGDNGDEPQSDGSARCSDDKDDQTTGPRWFPAIEIRL